MQHRPGTLFLLLSLFVALSANSAWACGNNAAETCPKEAAQKSCCAEKRDRETARCADQLDGCAQKHPGQSCSDSQGCGGCPCPCGLVMSGHAAAIEELPLVLAPLSSSDATLRQAFYYAQHMPEAVYLAIWQPPQLGV